MQEAHPFDIEMSKIMRRTVAYFSTINKRSDLTDEDKEKLKDHFLKYTFLPKAETLHQKHTPRTGHTPKTAQQRKESQLQPPKSTPQP